MFPPHVDQASVDVVVAALDEKGASRRDGDRGRIARSGALRVDLYPDVAKKMDRIFKHVDQRNAKFIAILGATKWPQAR